MARFDDYADAQEAVDRRSDDGFPVEQLDIIGSELRLVERITGRPTKMRTAAAGALGGLWVGLLIGILFGLFTTGHAWLAVAATGVGLGVAWGAVFGFVAHLASRGKRDFSSMRVLSAARYDLVAREGAPGGPGPCFPGPGCYPRRCLTGPRALTRRTVEDGLASG